MWNSTVFAILIGRLCSLLKSVMLIFFSNKRKIYDGEWSIFEKFKSNTVWKCTLHLLREPIFILYKDFAIVKRPSQKVKIPLLAYFVDIWILIDLLNFIIHACTFPVMTSVWKFLELMMSSKIFSIVGVSLAFTTYVIEKGNGERRWQISKSNV